MRSKTTDYPDVNLHNEEVFIVVKTYPRPSSSKYRELVCTAGITRKSKWIRLYPINYRYLDFNNWYKKYQWISVDILKNAKDSRIDSYRPIEKTIKIIGEPLSTDHDKKWLKRKEIILPTLQFASIEEIEKGYDQNKISLGIIKPKEIIDFKIESDTETWSKNQLKNLNQMRLFEQQPKSIEKIPYKFSYRFRCNDSKCKTHELVILDWEIFALYRNLKKQNPYEIDINLQKIKDRWFTDMWSSERDSYLIVGTQYLYHTFIVLGVFWPPK